LAVFEAEAFGLGEFLDRSTGKIIPVLTFTPSFFRGVGLPPTIYIYVIVYVFEYE
jgi:hypothetical protein